MYQSIFYNPARGNLDGELEKILLGIWFLLERYFVGEEGTAGVSHIILSRIELW